MVRSQWISQMETEKMIFILTPLIGVAAYFAVHNAMTGEFVTAFAFTLLTLGSGMNFAVAAANGWRMPVVKTGHIVVPRALEVALYPICFWFFLAPALPGRHAYVESSRLLFLADRIQIYSMQASVGDMFIAFGASLQIGWTVVETVLILLKLR